MNIRITQAAKKGTKNNANYVILTALTLSTTLEESMEFITFFYLI